LSEKGLILEANLTAASLLGGGRSTLIKQPFSRFILPEDQDLYYQFRKDFSETNLPQICELQMVRMDNTLFRAHLWATAPQVIDNIPSYLIAVIDMTAKVVSNDRSIPLREV
jgi:PAS domain-containing protein